MRNELSIFHSAFRSPQSAFTRGDLVVGCECLFAWYWLADLCADEKIPFVLGQAICSPVYGAFRVAVKARR